MDWKIVLVAFSPLPSWSWSVFVSGSGGWVRCRHNLGDGSEDVFIVCDLLETYAIRKFGVIEFFGASRITYNVFYWTLFQQREELCQATLQDSCIVFILPFCWYSFFITINFLYHPLYHQLLIRFHCELWYLSSCSLIKLGQERQNASRFSSSQIIFFQFMSFSNSKSEQRSKIILYHSVVDLNSWTIKA